MTEEKSKFHDREQRAEGKAVNMQFALLSALGMFFVVDGHLNNSYLDIGGLFPYYSFHMPLFAFISGYFYRPGSEERIGEYARKKILRLLGPYMAYNLIYGIAAQFLHGAGFSFGGSLSFRSLFLELLYLLVTRFMKKEDDQGSIRQKRHLDKLSNITAYLKNNYDKDITLESVAATFGFSPTYLSRMFKRYASVSYKTYLLDLRTEYGLREMMNTSHSLSEVALNNGFPNGRAFSKAFVKRYGCLPSEYRRVMDGEN